MFPSGGRKHGVVSFALKGGEAGEEDGYEHKYWGNFRRIWNILKMK